MIGVTRDGHVMTLEMQRAERRNALNCELVDGLREAIEKAAAEDVRAIVLTGQGTVFSAGADLTDAAGVAEELPDKAKALNLAIDAAPVPVIGAINGPAIGAGVILAMICDLRVVAPEAYFQFPVAKYGLALDNWSIRRLTSLVGAGRARGMLLAAERLTADVALQTGMANRIGTLADAQAWAAEIAGFAPLALQHAKRVLNDDGAYEDPWPEHTGAVRQGVGQPGRHRGAGGAHREAAAELPGRLTADAGCGAAIRGRDGHRRRRRLGAARAAGVARRRRRPPGRDLAGRSAVAELPGRRVRQHRPGVVDQPRPRTAAPARSGSWSGRRDSSAATEAHPAGRAAEGGDHTARPRGQLVRPLLGAGRGRRLPRAHRPGVEPTVFAVADGRPAADARGAGAVGGAACPRRGADQPRPLRPPGHRHHRRAWPAVSGRRSSCRSESARTCASGASRTAGSSNSTGTRATGSAS